MDLSIPGMSYKCNMIFALLTWLISFSTIRRFICVVACVNTSLLSWPNNFPLYGYVYLIHSSIDGYLGFSHLLVILASPTTGLLYEYLGTDVWVPIFHSLGYIPKSGTNVPYSNSKFHFLRNFSNHQFVLNYPPHFTVTLKYSHFTDKAREVQKLAWGNTAHEERTWEGLPWWSSGLDSARPVQSAWVQPLVKLNAARHNEDLLQPNKRKTFFFFLN